MTGQCGVIYLVVFHEKYNAVEREIDVETGNNFPLAEDRIPSSLYST
jgi:hypothetical protein